VGRQPLAQGRDVNNSTSAMSLLWVRAQQEALPSAAPLIASFAAVWMWFHVLAWRAPLGFVLCWFVVFCVGQHRVMLRTRGREAARDRLASVLVLAGSLGALVPLVFLFSFIVQKGLAPLWRSVPGFLTHDLRRAGTQDPVTRGGFWHAIIGSAEQVGFALAFVAPVALVTALYLNELGGRIAAPVRFVVDALSGVPSIIAGLFIYVLWVTQLREQFSGLAGSMAVMVLVLPILIRTFEEVLRLVPGGLREAALALGAPEWKVALRIVVPTSAPGLVTGLLLGTARAVGETAPVLLTAFGSEITNTNLFRAPQADLPLSIYQQYRFQTPNALDRAWAGSLVLTLLVLMLFTLARLVIGRAAKSG